MITNAVRGALQRVCFVLNKNGAEYLLVGGVAVGYYGYNRISGASLHNPEMKTDLDFWYKPTNENYLIILTSLEELGIDVSSLRSIVFDPQKTFLKIPHSNFHTDFLPQMKGLGRFQEAKQKAKKHVLDGNELFIISYDDLMINKMAVNRETDRHDITELKKKRDSEAG